MEKHLPSKDSYLKIVEDQALLDLKQDFLLYLLPVLFFSGFLILIFTPIFPLTLISVGTSLGIYGLTLLIWFLRKVNHQVAAWTIILGTISIILALVVITGSEVPIILLALPPSLAILLLSIPAGILTAGVCTGLVLFARIANGPTLQWTTVVLIWSSIGIVFLAWRALLTINDWALYSYYDNHRLLEQARDNQFTLAQTMSDLMDANVQLTRLNRLAQNLQHAAEEAKIEKENFVASVSHELRTPLNMILGFGEMILKTPASYGRKLPKALLADLTVIVRNSQHLSGLIDDILDLSRIEAGQMSLSREDTPYNEIVEAAVTAVRPLFVSKNLFLETEISENLTVFCDRTRIREVLINLLSNAGRFTENGGVKVKVWREDKEVITRVMDSGPGITEEDQKKLFKPFQQLENSYRRRFGGTGLGLSISKSLIDLHNGRIWVESVFGQGSTFSFSLPIYPPTMPESKALRWFQNDQPVRERTRRSLATPPVIIPRYVILEVGHSLHRLISRHLVEVDLVSVMTIEDAILELQRVPSQGLLINMPSSQETLSKLKESILPLRTPVILCSLPDLANGDASLGIASYLVKPITLEPFLAALNKIPGLPRTILIVDDEPEASRLYWRMLTSTQQNYRVLVAGDGRQGLNILREEKPDLVFLDMVMPEMDGFQFLSIKNREPLLAEIPVIVITASDPAGHPIISDAITITQQGGLSTNQILACIKMLNQITVEAVQTAHPASLESLPG